MFRFGSLQSLLALGIAVVAVGIVAVPQAGAQPPSGWLPLQLTGYNADVIADREPSVRFAQLFDQSCCAWFETGLVDDNGTEHDDGLVTGSVFASLTNSGVNYMIQPAVYNNVLQISNDPGAQGQGVPASGTLTLLNPAAYSKIAIFSSSGNSHPDSVGNLTVTYDDGSTLNGTFNTFDWCGGTNALSVIPPSPIATLAATGISRVTGGATATGAAKFTYGFGCGPQGFEAYETIIPVDNTKKIVSVAFTAPTDGTIRSNVFGISAIP
jgi:hypothetical protein